MSLWNRCARSQGFRHKGARHRNGSPQKRRISKRHPIRNALTGHACSGSCTVDSDPSSGQSDRDAVWKNHGHRYRCAWRRRAWATAVLSGPDPADRRTAETDQNGFFQFDAPKPGIAYQISVSASGFEPWSSANISVYPGQFKLLDNIQLRIATEHTTVEVRYEPEQVATEQIRLEEKQRILGIIPNFYVSYEGENTEPLTSKMKFQLALRVSYDPVTIAGVAFTAGFRQAANSPDYQQGLKGT